MKNAGIAAALVLAILAVVFVGTEVLNLDFFFGGMGMMPMGNMGGTMGGNRSSMGSGNRDRMPQGGMPSGMPGGMPGNRG